MDYDPNDDTPPSRMDSGTDAEGYGYGGAILCENASSPTFKNVVIEDCYVTAGPAGHGVDGSEIQEGDDTDGYWGGHGGDASGISYGGAVACIGSTRVGFGGFAGDPFIAGTSCMHRYFFEAYEPGIHLGDMFIQAQQSFIKNIMNTVIYEPLTVQEFILLGDPSLKIGGYP